MTDDTRDIAIQTRADLKNVSDQLGELKVLVRNLHETMVERRGAEKVARWVVGVSAGGAGAIITKIGAAITNIPFPK